MASVLSPRPAAASVPDRAPAGQPGAASARDRAQAAPPVVAPLTDLALPAQSVVDARPAPRASGPVWRQPAARWRRALAAQSLPWVVPLLIIAAWQAAAQLGWLSSRILPAPSAVLKAFWQLSASGELWKHLATSTWRALTGFAIGGGLGLGLGLLTGSLRRAETLLDGTVQMIRNIPPLALIPLVILWFGIDETAKIFLVSLGVFFPIYVNTFHGIRAVDAGLVEMARSYGLTGGALYRAVILPGALPSILVGVRFSLGFMWVILIVAETISATSGIGYLTMNAREFLQTDIVLVGILLYALLGKLADVLARALERWWLRWHPAYQRPAAGEAG